jgi:hypothetical protein
MRSFLIAALCLTACSGHQVTPESCVTVSRHAGRAAALVTIICGLASFPPEKCEAARRTWAAATDTATAACGFLPKSP